MKLSVIMTLLFICSLGQTGCTKTEKASVTAGEALSMIRNDTGIVLLDVRTPAEFEGELGHLEGAILIPVQELEERSGELSPYKDRTIVAYCRTGRRSLKATEILREKGFDVLNLEGGMVDWNGQNLPLVVHGK